MNDNGTWLAFAGLGRELTVSVAPGLDVTSLWNAIVILMPGWSVRETGPVENADVSISGTSSDFTIRAESWDGGIWKAAYANEVAYALAGMLIDGILALGQADFCLHAAAVEIDGRAVLFVGPSGAGKSTMALRLAAAWFAGALSWLHIQDFEFDAAIELGLLPHFLSGPARRSERFLLRRFQAVSSISPRMVDRLEGKGVPRERTAMFPNWVDTRRIRPDADGAAFRAELGIGADTVVALYSGNIGEKQGIEQIATAAKYVSENRGPGDPPVRFVLAGAGAGREVIEQAVRAHGLGEDAFTLLPLQPEEKLPVLLAMADIHLLPQRAEAADLVMPSKLGGMLSSGRPVVASAAAGTQIAGTVSGCGTVVEPGDGNAIGAAVLELARDADARVRLGLAARAEAEANWDRESVLARFEEEVVRRLAARKGAKA